MSARADAMRAAATALETAVVRPWTAAMPEVVGSACAQLRAGADAVDKAVSLGVSIS